jgi:hypothetical protein
MTTTADALDAILAAVGVPPPDREHRFAPPRRWKFDYAWPAHQLALEVEGGTWVRGRHSRGKGYAADCEKYNAAALMGWRVLRVTSDMMRDGRALALLQRAFGREGTGGRSPGGS